MSGSVGGIDASIPLQAKAPAPVNPLATIGQFAQTQNALNQNKMFPGQQQLQQGEITRQQQGIQGGQVDLQGKINQAAYGSLTPLLALPPGGITHDTLTTALASTEKNLGLPTNGVLQHVLATSPSGDGPQFDAKVRSLIAAGAQPYAAAAGQVTPQAGPIIDSGPQLQPTTVSPTGSASPGVVAPAGGSYTKGLGPQFVNTGAGAVPTNNGQPVAPGISNQLSPAQLATPTQIGIDQKGAPIMGTLGQFLDKTGGSPLGTGRLPDALRNPNAPPPVTPAGIPMGVGPAKEAQLSTQGGTSAHAFQDYADQGVQARGQSAVLGNMLGDISSFTPGPEKINEFQKTLQRYAPSIASTFGVDPKSVAANESFDKLANQIAGAQGERSDARLAVAQNANPGSHLSPGGADLIIRQLQGNADYLQARAKLASSYPDQTDRAGFESKVGSQLDPRAFQFERMTPQQKMDYVAHLSAKDKSSLQSSYNFVHNQGLIGGDNGG